MLKVLLKAIHVFGRRIEQVSSPLKHCHGAGKRARRCVRNQSPDRSLFSTEWNVGEEVERCRDLDFLSRPFDGVMRVHTSGELRLWEVGEEIWVTVKCDKRSFRKCKSDKGNGFLSLATRNSLIEF